MNDAVRKYVNDKKEPLMIVGAAVVAIPLLYAGSLVFGGDDAPDEPDLGRARVICEEMVSQQLKNPSTADFAYPDVQNSARIAGSLTGENVLGGKQTLNYSCALSAGKVTDVTVTPR